MKCFREREVRRVELKPSKSGFNIAGGGRVAAAVIAVGFDSVLLSII